ncbi:Zn2/Cys6 DNA-binding protein [Glarea lozoyensis ATCC 20868]|uniref:Zn2/Cys6 DNA-binding protein n=1 Tax=Glarea lozoyensis (strain ATCC 20868 / MF5171) TaxID=1116229 RepID=S3DH93_GLAL2|nr:Zn2/Cys6 DNA-binding protein [Glarea lozoyensis ATCC 20868]EPE36529.1 Zn2/Cys6 DNA-binding protein [Glarea lozoyensis ATCC 20868]
MEAVNTSRRVPPEKRKRTETSCDKCKTRKQKCDRIMSQSQCRYCQLHAIACTTTQPRKKRLYGNAESIGGRLVLLESLVKGLVPEADLSTNDEMQQLGKSLGIPLPVIEESIATGDADAIETKDDDYTLPLLPDQQGQVQYIGPSSSFSFHLHLRKLIGNDAACEFSMFGQNAADQYETAENPLVVSKRQNSLGSEDRRGSVPTDYGSPSDAVREIDGPVLETLVDTYFDVIHSDFPVLHEASFRGTYETWSLSSSSADPSWLCGLLCVLILSRRVASITIPDEAERKWWRHVQTLLPTVFFTSNLYTVQALMLAALHLHNTSHRDACWNITGTAVRIAFAIGLHRDDVKHTQSPLGRELRKQLWWTLYAFEHMQVSSYDRPSAIAYTLSSVSFPNERIVGVAGHCPQDFMKWSQRLVVLLGSACRALNPTGSGSTSAEDAYSGPLSPAAGVLRELDKWKEALPLHLRLEVTDSLAPSSQRPLLLLHVQFYYIRVLMSRAALLRRATRMSKDPESTLTPTLLTVSETCIDSGRSLACIMRKLGAINKFNSCTWWDIFYTVASSLILVLDIICHVKQGKHETLADSQKLLHDLATMVSSQLDSSKVPGSMRTWGAIVIEVSAMADQYVLTFHRAGKDEQQGFSPDKSPLLKSPKAISGGSLDCSLSAIPSHHARASQDHFWPQLSYMDDANDNLQDWSWDDIGEILRAGAS